MMTRCICNDSFAMSKSCGFSSRSRFRFRQCDVRCLGIAFQSLQHVILPLLVAMFMTSICAAQSSDVVPGFWGLKQGDKIVFAVAGSRRTEIVVDGQPSVTQETSESLQIQFTSFDFERNGDVVVRVEVRQIDRKPETAAAASLNVPQIFLRVQPDGKVSTLNPEIRELLLATLAEGNPETMNILKKCLTEESVSSWFSVAFWSRGPAEDGEKQDAWERTHEVSLGTLGTLQLDMRFLRGEGETDMSKVAITGDARFRPLVLPDADTETFPFFSNVSVEIDEISGKGVISQPPTGKNAVSSRGPGFESVEWTLKLHGEAKLLDVIPSKSNGAASRENKDAAAAETDIPTGKVTFRHTQHCIWKLQSFEPAGRRMFDNDRFSIPQ